METAASKARFTGKLEQLRTELAEKAYRLELQGRRDAADEVMLIDIRVREMIEEIAAAGTGEELRPAQPSATAEFRRAG